MNRPAMMVVTALLVSCGGENSSARQSSDWLVGEWLPLGPDTPYPLACESDAVILYEADGTFHIEVGSGSWKLEGDRLTETLTTIHDPEPETSIPPETHRSRVERLEGDRFRKHLADHASELYRRCLDQ